MRSLSSGAHSRDPLVIAPCQRASNNQHCKTETLQSIIEPARRFSRAGLDMENAMKRFDKVVDILDTAVNHAIIGKHGNFWRGKTREQFIALKVFGRILIQTGKSADSNIVKALRGLAPFGVDIDPPAPNAIFDRMPAGRPAVPELSIRFIEKWIDDGCPNDDVVEPESPMPTLEAVALGPVQFIRFFREFDQFFSFEATDDTSAAIGDFFAIAQSWPGFKQTTNLPAWTNAISAADVKNAVQFLSDNQLRVMTKHFSDPLDENSLTEAFWQFGKGILPTDNQRPQDPFHRMNGSQMWLMWLAFADASIRSGIKVPQWTSIAKCICLGLVGDALFRTDRPAPSRLKISRYRADDPTLRQRVVGDFATLNGNTLLDATIGLGREARFGAPVA
jgi:hypothetical protein